MRDLITHHLDISSDRQAKYYNQKRRDVRFNIGDVVWRKSHVLSSATDYITRKLAPKYEGPFKVIKVLSPVVYQVQNESGKIEKTHIKDLKYYWSVDPECIETVNIPFRSEVSKSGAADASQDVSGPQGSSGTTQVRADRAGAENAARARRPEGSLPLDSGDEEVDPTKTSCIASEKGPGTP